MCHCGGKGTANADYILRTIIERTMELQERGKAMFIDYTKTFDKEHAEIIALLKGK